MRDPARIDVLLEALKECWHNCPDLRFGQLVNSILAKDEKRRDIFVPEDAEWLDWIQQFSKEAEQSYVWPSKDRSTKDK